MKKFILSIAVIALYAGYVIYNHKPNAADPALAIIPQTTNSPTPSPIEISGSSPTPTPTAVATTPTPTSTNKPTPTSAPTPTPTPTKSGQYKNGSFTGSVADAFYGNLQVRAVISGGKLTDVQFLQYPNDRGESQQVSAHSLPILRSEAISAQSASVDSVSGATQTSAAFVQSLASALAQAKN